MHRNVTILVIILAVILISGYLVWLRGRFAASNLSKIPTTSEVQVLTPKPEESTVASQVSPPVEATEEGKAATDSVKTRE